MKPEKLNQNNSLNDCISYNGREADGIIVPNVNTA